MVTWPEWSNVLPLATVAVTIAGAVAALFWTLSKMFRPMAVEVARGACDRLKADLESNHFHEIGERLDRMQVRFDERMDRFGSRMDRFGSRMDRFELRMDRMEAHFDDRLGRLESHFNDRMGRVESHFNDRMGRVERHFNERLDRMDRRAEERTALILEAMQSQRQPEAENVDG